MEQFIVSARKYRPGTFQSVVGQEHITQTLKNAIKNNHLAQAFLFCGPRGVGKTTCARILAKTINCQNLQDNIEPCNECESCTSFNKNSSFNIYELDAASNNSVEDIRALVDQVRYAPQGSKYKIYIIDEVHMLSNQAFNAFLKTLEEPPSYAIFILATTERHKIIPTILSRCQIFDFNRITIPDMVAHLQSIAQQESIVAEEEALHMISEKADGALRDALSIFDQMVSFSGEKLGYEDVIKNLNILDYDYYFKAVDLLRSEDSSGALLLLDEIIRKGFEPHLFLGGLADHFRNLLVSKDPSTHGLLEVAEAAAIRYKEQASECDAGFLVNALNLTNQFEASYRNSRNHRLHTELALLKIAFLPAVLNMEPTAAQVKSPVQEKKTPDQSVTPTQATSTTPKKVATPPKSETVKKVEPEPEKKPKKSIDDVLDIDLGLDELDLASKPKTNSEETKESEGEEESAPIKQHPLNLDSLKAIWTDFALMKEKQRKFGLAMGMKKSVISLEDKTLHAKVVGKHVKDFMEEVRTDLVGFINARLETSIAALTIEIEKNEEQDELIYTLEDKLQSMSKSNPELVNMIKKLGLEIDY